MGTAPIMALALGAPAGPLAAMPAAPCPPSASSRRPREPPRGAPRATPRRPASSAIAVTPLESLPPSCVAEALRLSAKGEEALNGWLSSDAVRCAMRRQSVEVEDLRHAAAVCGSRGVTGAEARRGQQLLAQVAWEVELCSSAERPPTATAPSSPSPWAVPQTSLAHGHQLEPKPPCRLPPDQLPSLAGEKLHARMHHWNREDKVPEGVRQVGLLRMEQAQEKMGQGKHKKDHHRTALFQDQKTGQRKRCALDEVSHQKELENVKHESMSSRTPDTEHSSNAMRWGAGSVTPRQPMPLRQHDLLFLDSGKVQQEHVDAGTHQGHALRARSAGPPALQAVREVVRRHAIRVERIREVEQESMQNCLEGRQQGQPCSSTVPAQALGTPRVENGLRETQPTRPSGVPRTARRPIRYAGAPAKSAICGHAAESPIAHTAAVAGDVGAYVPDGDCAADEPEAETAPAEPSPAVSNLVSMGEGHMKAEPTTPAPTGDAAEEALVDPLHLFPQGGFRELPANVGWFAACASKAFHDLLSWTPHEDGQDEEQGLGQETDDEWPTVAEEAAAPERSGRSFTAMTPPDVDEQEALTADQSRFQDAVPSDLLCFQRSERRSSKRVVPGATCDILGAADDGDAIMQLEELSDGEDYLIPEI
mmetsp:Transcript_13161/g.37578  ORF Transcript_13161/g.37578 Transcript_13161/m.37578 type:complete len:649 (+) Transcript_13161:76-2022(+)